MKPQDLAMIADIMGLPEALVPVMHELMTDFQALGGWPDEAAAAMRGTGLDATHRVADLGCGKGAVGIRLACEFACRVDGFDLHPPFLDDAREAAEAAGVGDRCTYIEADLREILDGTERWDAVVYSALGSGLFGGHATCVAALRQAVRPGGWMLVADGYLQDARDGQEAPPGFGYYRTLDETRDELAAHGDVVVSEVFVSPAAMEADDARGTAWLRRRAPEVAQRHPELREAIDAMFEGYAREGDWMTRATGEACWVLQRA
ncbi:MAG: class I SAM-dependent methyltransferase [Xanthomonadales bacterium]|nr:class I SAM-dependent methyltransferase [Xanthomonadales bacterium]